RGFLSDASRLERIPLHSIILSLTRGLPRGLSPLALTTVSYDMTSSLCGSNAGNARCIELYIGPDAMRGPPPGFRPEQLKYTLQPWGEIQVGSSLLGSAVRDGVPNGSVTALRCAIQMWSSWLKFPRSEANRSVNPSALSTG